MSKIDPNTWDFSGPPPTQEQLDAARVAVDAEILASLEPSTVLFSQMLSLTDDIILWSQSAKAFLFGPLDENGVPQFGSVDKTDYNLLMQRCESAIVSYKSLTKKTQEVVDQYEWLMARSMEATALGWQSV